MKEVAEHAGRNLGHAIWSIEDGETLIPMLITVDRDGKAMMERLIYETDAASAKAQGKLDNPSPEDAGIVFITDTNLQMGEDKSEALVVEIGFIPSDAEQRKLTVAVPYRNAKEAEGFKIGRLKVIGLEGIEREELDSVMQAFFDGITSHPQGSEIWNRSHSDAATHESNSNEAASDNPLVGLMYSPLLVFLLVAGADGKVEPKEVQSFLKVLTDKAVLSHPILNAIVNGIAPDLQQHVQELIQTGDNYLEQLTEIAELADANFEQEMSESFKYGLYYIGEKVASTSRGFWGFGGKPGKPEKAALAAIAGVLNISPKN
ncbi:hypothetical protein L2750_00805 [Shewanella submarina]|uniref:Uncharacterized protein n=1 Tax=Shewanella submarina TaxID=2016376 RepID=A0ABV7GHT5_9GAMM|nr:hypothetical protein [Shewanella submarina]MCL1035698.1 hypothetical protein [Shewanella submarina]